MIDDRFVIPIKRYINKRTSEALIIRLGDFIFQSIHLRNNHINRFDVCSNPDCVFARELILEIKQKLLPNYNAEEAQEREIEERRSI
jgi:hypothetical protein